MWRVGSRGRFVVVGLTTTKVLIVDVGRGSSIHHGGVAVNLPRVVEVWWRRKIHRLADGRVLDVVLSEQSVMTRLQLDELLINMLPMCTNVQCIVLSHIETSKETLREKVENTLFLAWGERCLEMRMAHERRKVAHRRMGHRRRGHPRERDEEGHACPT
jgi:hypothetical protein